MSPVDNPEISVDKNLNIETENTQIEDQTPSIPNKDRKNISDIRKTIIEPSSQDISDLKNWENLITEIRHIADKHGDISVPIMRLFQNFVREQFSKEITVDVI